MVSILLNGEMYEVEPAVKVIIDNLMIENAELKKENNRLEGHNLDLQAEFCKQGAKIDELKKENARLEESFRKATGVIAATDCAECKDKPVKHGHWITDDSKIYLKHKCSECGHAVILKYPYCENCGAEMDRGAENA